MDRRTDDNRSGGTSIVTVMPFKRYTESKNQQQDKRRTQTSRRREMSGVKERGKKQHVNTKGQKKETKRK